MGEGLYFSFMKISRKGVTRIVIILRRYVIKIPNFTCQWSHFLRGLIGNMSENQTWKWNSGKYETGKSHLLCPVLWCSWGGWILIMKRVDELITDDNREFWDCDEHIKFFKGDDSISNYGILSGKLVKIDYADLDSHWGEDFKPPYLSSSLRSTPYRNE